LTVSGFDYGTIDVTCACTVLLAASLLSLHGNQLSCAADKGCCHFNHVSQYQHASLLYLHGNQLSCAADKGCRHSNHVSQYQHASLLYLLGNQLSCAADKGCRHSNHVSHYQHASSHSQVCPSGVSHADPSQPGKLQQHGRHQLGFW